MKTFLPSKVLKENPDDFIAWCILLEIGDIRYKICGDLTDRIAYVVYPWGSELLAYVCGHSPDRKPAPVGTHPSYHRMTTLYKRLFEP